MTTVSTKSHIGVEDFKWGPFSETFKRSTSSGGSITLHKFGFPWVDITHPDYGAIGDDSTDDTDAITAAITAIPNTGGLLVSPPGKTYKVTDGFLVEKPISIDFYGSKIKRYGTSFPTSSVLFYYRSPTLYTRTFAGAVSAGSVTFTLNSSVGLSIGDSVVLQFGEAEYDATQPWLTMFNTVGNIVGNNVTFKIPVPETINKGAAHKCLVLTRIVENVSVKNIQFEDDSAAETDSLMYISRCRNVKLENVYIPSAAGALINDQSENVSFENILSKRSRYYAGLGSSGTFIGGWGFRNFKITNAFAENVDRIGISFEAMGRGATLENIYVQQGTDSGTTPYGIYVIGYCKRVFIKNYTYHSINALAYSLLTGEGAEVETENVIIPYTAVGLPLEKHHGMIGWTDGAGTLLTYYTQTKMFSRIFALSPSMSLVDIGIPDGIYKSVKMYFSSKTGLTNVIFGTATGDSYDAIATVPAAGVFGKINSAALTTLGNAATYPFNNNPTGKYCKLVTDGTVPVNTYGVIEIEYYPKDEDDSQGMIQYDLNNYVLNNRIATLANDATPSVLGYTKFLTGGTTTITNLINGVTGQVITIISEHAITITDGTNIFLNGSANFVMAATDTLTLIRKADGKWYEIGRSDNT